MNILPEVTRRIQIPDAVKQSCLGELRRMRETTPGLRILGLVGPDGFEIAWLAASGSSEQSKISALVSTLIAVAQAFTRETGLTACRELVLGTDTGRVLLIGITINKNTYGFFLVAEENVLLGALLAKAEICVQTLARALKHAET